MSNYKNDLVELLQKSVTELFSGVLVSYEITENGFFCDFDLAETLNPERIGAINRWLSERDVSCAYELSDFSGAYKDGDSSKKMLQRIHITAFETQNELLSLKTGC